MNPPREGSAIVAAWLEEGPNELPESTRRAIAVDVRTTHQSRRSARFPSLSAVDRLSLVAMAAVAVMALVIGGLVMRPFASGESNIGGPPPAPSASPAPSPSEAPSAAESPWTVVIPAMSERYVSGRYGYSVMYPADWSVEEATQTWWPPDWKANEFARGTIRLHRWSGRTALPQSGFCGPPGRLGERERLDRRVPHLWRPELCATA